MRPLLLAAFSCTATLAAAGPLADRLDAMHALKDAEQRRQLQSLFGGGGSGGSTECPLAAFQMRSAEVNDVCCPDPALCATGLPDVCDLDCAVLPPSHPPSILAPGPRRTPSTPRTREGTVTTPRKGESESRPSHVDYSLDSLAHQQHGPGPLFLPCPAGCLHELLLGLRGSDDHVAGTPVLTIVGGGGGGGQNVCTHPQTH